MGNNKSTEENELEKSWMDVNLPLESENDQGANRQNHRNRVHQSNPNSEATDSQLDVYKQGAKQLNELDIHMINSKITEESANELEKNETDNVNVFSEETENSQRKNEQSHVNLVEQPNFNSEINDSLLNRCRQGGKPLNELDIQMGNNEITEKSENKSGKNMLDIQMDNNKITEEPENELGKNETGTVNVFYAETENSQGKNNQNDRNLIQQSNLNSEGTDSQLDKCKQGEKILKELDIQMDNYEITEESEKKLGKNETNNVNVSSEEMENGQGKNEQIHVNLVEQPNLNCLLDKYRQGEKALDKLNIQMDNNKITEEPENELGKNKTGNVTVFSAETENGQGKNNQIDRNLVQQSNLNSEATFSQLDKFKQGEKILKELDVQMGNYEITKEIECELGRNEICNIIVSSGETENSQGKSKQIHVNLAVQSNINSETTDSLLDKYRQGEKTLNELYIQMGDNEITKESENEFGKNETDIVNVLSEETENGQGKNEQNHVNLVEQPNLNSEAIDSLLDTYRREKSLNELNVQIDNNEITEESEHELRKNETNDLNISHQETENGRWKNEQNCVNPIEQPNHKPEAIDSLLDKYKQGDKQMNELHIQMNINEITEESENKIGKNETNNVIASFEETENYKEKNQYKHTYVVDPTNFNSGTVDFLSSSCRKRGRPKKSKIQNEVLTFFKQRANGERNELDQINLTEQKNISSEVTDSSYNRHKQGERKLKESDIQVNNNTFSEEFDHKPETNVTNNINILSDKTEDDQKKYEHDHKSLVEQINFSSEIICTVSNSYKKRGRSKKSKIQNNNSTLHKQIITNNEKNQCEHLNIVENSNLISRKTDSFLNSCRKRGRPRKTENQTMSVICLKQNKNHDQNKHKNVNLTGQTNFSLGKTDTLLNSCKKRGRPKGLKIQISTLAFSKKTENVEENNQQKCVNLPDLGSFCSVTSNSLSKNFRKRGRPKKSKIQNGSRNISEKRAKDDERYKQDQVDVEGQTNFKSEKNDYFLGSYIEGEMKLKDLDVQLENNTFTERSEHEPEKKEIEDRSISSEKTVTDQEKRQNHVNILQPNPSSGKTDCLSNSCKKRGRPRKSEIQTMSHTCSEQTENNEQPNNYDVNVTKQANFNSGITYSLSNSNRKRGRPKKSVIQSNSLILSKQTVNKHIHINLLELPIFNSDPCNRQGHVLDMYKHEEKILKESIQMSKNISSKKCEFEKNEMDDINLSSEEIEIDGKNEYEQTNYAEQINITSNPVDSVRNSCKRRGRPKKSQIQTISLVSSEEAENDGRKDQCEHVNAAEQTNFSSETTDTLSNSCKKRGRPKKSKIEINSSFSKENFERKKQHKCVNVPELGNLSSGTTNSLSDNCRERGRPKKSKIQNNILNISEQKTNDERYKHDQVNLTEQANLSSERSDCLLHKYKQGEKKLKDVDVKMENNAFIEESTVDPGKSEVEDISSEKSVNDQGKKEQNHVNFLRSNLSPGGNDCLSNSCKKRGRPRKSESRTMSHTCSEQTENNEQPNNYDVNLTKQANFNSGITYSLSNSSRKRGRPKKSVIQSNSLVLSKQTVNKHIHINLLDLPIFSSEPCDSLLDMHKPEESKLKESDVQMSKNISSNKSEREKNEIGDLNLLSGEIENDGKYECDLANHAEQANICKTSKTVDSLRNSCKKRGRPKKLQIQTNNHAPSKEAENDERKKQYEDVNLTAHQNLIAGANDSLAKCCKKRGRPRKLKLQSLTFSKETDNDEERNYHKLLNQAEQANFRSVDSSSNSFKKRGRPKKSVIQTNSLTFTEQIVNNLVQVNLYKLPIFSSEETDSLLERHKGEEKKLKVSDLQTSKNTSTRNMEHELEKTEHDHLDLAIHSSYSSNIFESVSISCKKRGRPKKLKVQDCNSVSTNSLLHRKLQGKRKLKETDIEMNKNASTTESDREPEENETNDINSTSKETENDLKKNEHDHVNLVEQTQCSSITNNSLSNSGKKRSRPKKLKIEMNSFAFFEETQNQEEKRVHATVNLAEQIKPSLKKIDSVVNSCQKRGRPKKSQIQNNSLAPSEENEKDERENQHENINLTEEANFNSVINDSISNNSRQKESVIKTDSLIFCEQTVNKIVRVNLYKLPIFSSGATDSLLWGHKQREKKLKKSDILLGKNALTKHFNCEPSRHEQNHTNPDSPPNYNSEAVDSLLINCKKRDRSKKSEIQGDSHTFSERTLKNHIPVNLSKQPNFSSVVTDSLLYKHTQRKRKLKETDIAMDKSTSKKSMYASNKRELDDIMTSSEETENDLKKNEYDYGNRVEHSNLNFRKINSFTNNCRKRGRPRKLKIKTVSHIFSEQIDIDESNKHDQVNVAGQGTSSSGTADSLSNSCKKKSRLKKSKIQINSLSYFGESNNNEQKQHEDVNLTAQQNLIVGTNDFLAKCCKKRGRSRKLKVQNLTFFKETDKEEERNDHKHLNQAQQANFKSVDSTLNSVRKRGRPKKSVIQTNNLAFTEQIANKFVQVNLYKLPIFSSGATDSLLKSHKGGERKLKISDIQTSKNISTKDIEHDHLNLMAQSNCSSRTIDSLSSNCKKRGRPKNQVNSVAFSEQVVNNNVPGDVFEQTKFNSGISDSLLDRHIQRKRKLNEINFKKDKNIPTEESEYEPEKNETNDINSSSEETENDLIKKELDHANPLDQPSFVSVKTDFLSHGCRKRGRPRKPKIQTVTHPLLEQTGNDQEINEHDEINPAKQTNSSSGTITSLSNIYKKRGRPRKPNFQSDRHVSSEETENDKEKNRHENINRTELANFSSETTDSLSSSCRKGDRPRDSNSQSMNIILSEQTKNDDKNVPDQVNISEQTNFNSTIMNCLLSHSTKRGRPRKSVIHSNSFIFSEQTVNNHATLFHLPNISSKAIDFSLDRQEQEGRNLTELNIQMDKNALTEKSVQEHEENHINLSPEETENMPVKNGCVRVKLAEQQNLVSETIDSVSNNSKKTDTPNKLKTQVNSFTLFEQTENDEEKHEHSCTSQAQQPNISSEKTDCLLNSCRKRGRPKKLESVTFSEETENTEGRNNHDQVNAKQANFSSESTNSLLKTYKQRGRPKKSKIQADSITFSGQQRERNLKKVNTQMDKNTSTEEFVQELEKNVIDDINLSSEKTTNVPVKNEHNHVKRTGQSKSSSEIFDPASNISKKRGRPKKSEIKVNFSTFSEQTVNDNVHNILLEQPNFISGSTESLLDTHKQAEINLKKLNTQMDKNTSTEECVQELEKNVIDVINVSFEETANVPVKNEHDHVKRTGQPKSSSEIFDPASKISKKRDRPKKSEIKVNFSTFSEQIENAEKNNRCCNVNMSDMHTEISSCVSEVCEKQRKRPKEIKIESDTHRILEETLEELINIAEEVESNVRKNEINNEILLQN